MSPSYSDSEAYPAGRCHECGQADDVGMEQWTEVLRLMADLLTAGDALVECFDGTLNKSIKDRESAVVEIGKRTRAYQVARKAVISYARSVEAVLR